MNVLNRAITSVKRRPAKSMVFLFLVILLGMLTAGAITVREAINNTDASLRRRMPSIMTIQAAHDETTYLDASSRFLTPELIRTVAALPYVEFFDYAIDVGHWTVTSTDLNPWQLEEVIWPLWNYDEALGAFIRPRGVSSPAFIDARDGLIALVDGRTFTEGELENNSEVIPVIISAELARINQLYVGATFESQIVIWEEGLEERENDPMIDVAFPMEVIGIFEPEVPEIPMDIDIGFPIYNQVGAVHHRVYLPNRVAEEMFDLRVAGEVMAHGSEFESDLQVFNFFVLADPAYDENFMRLAADLEGNWEIRDLSSGFQEISTSMENMSELADFILIGSIGATILIIGLLILLFLRGRKREIGIYLAMGDQKKTVIKQMILELIPLALVGLTLSLVFGSIASSALTQEMLRQDLSTVPTQESIQRGGPLEELGYRFSFSLEEMLDSYEISLDLTTITMFYGIGIVTVLIATVIPVIFIVNANPKKLLMAESE